MFEVGGVGDDAVCEGGGGAGEVEDVAQDGGVGAFADGFAVLVPYGDVIITFFD